MSGSLLIDILILAAMKTEAKRNVASALELLITLGFIINTSVIHPPGDRILGLHNIGLQKDDNLTPKYEAEILANGSSKPQVPEDRVTATASPAPLHFRCLERAKSKALRCGLPYDAQVQVAGLYAES